MTEPLKQRVDRLTALMIDRGARLTLQDIAIRCLLATHPHPDRLRAAFEAAGTRFLDHALDSRLSDQALEDVRGLYQTYLALIGTVPVDPADRS